MELMLTRKYFTNVSTEGELYINGKFECYTLEDKDRSLEENPEDKIYGETAIPRGRYEVVMSMSNRFGKMMPEILNVPNFKGIRIHTGNSSLDTDGCILVGATSTKKDDNFIGNSKVAYNKLFDKLMEATKNKNDIFITIK